MTNYLTAVGVQQVSITIPTGATTATATINAVGAGAFVVFQGQTATDTVAQLDDSLCSIALTNATTITASRGVSSASKTCTVNAVIIDGDTTNLIKSVQTGTIAVSTTSNTASISPVTNNNAATVCLGQMVGASSSNLDALVVISLSSTTVTALRTTSAGVTTTIQYQIVEFQGSALNGSVQNFAYSTTKSGTSDTVTLSSITTANTMIFNGSQSVANGVNNAEYMIYGALTSATVFTLTWNTSDSGAETRKYNGTAVQFASSGPLAQNIQRGTITISASTGNTANITSSATKSTLVNWLGNSTTTTTAIGNTTLFNITQTSPTVITESVNSSATGTGSYEAIQFQPFTTAIVGNSIWFGAIA